MSSLIGPISGSDTEPEEVSVVQEDIQEEAQEDVQEDAQEEPVSEQRPDVMN